MKFLAYIALFATLTLTACGGSDDGGGGGGVPAPTGPTATPDSGGNDADTDSKDTVVAKPVPLPTTADLKSLSAVEANKKIIAGVMAQLPAGKSIKAQGRTATQCGGIDYSYTVTPVDENVKVSLKTYFDFQTGMNDQQKRDMLIKTRRCIQPVRDFYGKYNIIFDWTYSSEKGGKFTKSDADVTVMLDSATGRASSRHWYSDSYGHNCKVIIHEIGHLLGLPDEYSEAGTCRTSQFASEVPSMMKQHTDPSADFLPRHILAILEQALVSKVEIKATRNDVDLENEVTNLADELESYNCELVSPQNLLEYIKIHGSVEYWESDLSSYVTTNIKMSDNQINRFFGSWTYWETSKWVRPTEVRCDLNENVFGIAMFSGEQFPLILEALGSSALKIEYKANGLNKLHKQFPPLIYSRIGALKDEEVVESEAVQRNYY